MTGRREKKRPGGVWTRSGCRLEYPQVRFVAKVLHVIGKIGPRPPKKAQERSLVAEDIANEPIFERLAHGEESTPASRAAVAPGVLFCGGYRVLACRSST